jgi:hypothetical protein
MLSEAVQLMGVVAQGGQAAALLQRATPAERARSRIAAQPPRDLAPREPPPREPPAAPATPPEPPPAAESPAQPPAGGLAGLRGRLRLTPTATDEAFRTAADAAAGQPPAPPPAAEDGAWSWKELLNTLDDAPAAESGPPTAAGPPPARTLSEPLRGAPMRDDGRLGEDLFREIEGMGIDPGALLPRGRIDEIAAAIQTGDGSGAREVVRALAPAAIRRIARRMLSDGAFRARVQALTTRYGDLIAEAAARDRQGFQAAALLATNPGRAYLLLDAAAGQPG